MGSLKSFLKVQKRKLETLYAERFLRFTPEQLREKLEELGVRAGDTLVVHSAFRSLRGFTGNEMDVIRLLQAMTGPEGTILMPNQPFTGSAVDWVESGAVWDQGRTPAKTGYLPEFFRRTPGVIRSLHPTHSVAGWGKRAEELLANHLQAKTPCGTGSPYLRLLDCGGKVLHLGSTIHATTFAHGVEELLNEQLPRPALTVERYRARVRDLAGEEHEIETRLYAQEMSRVRNLAIWEPEMKRRGYWREARISRLTILLLGVAELWEVSRDLAARGVFFYDFDRLLR
jgi:aminoglycoside 3-N-acetyltransferase